MEFIFRICLFLAGIINILPSLLVFLPQKIAESYGIDIPDGNYELLLRHRAVLFGIIGGIMVYSALTQKHYSLAVTIGFISMGSFVLLFLLIGGEINAELTQVMKIDIVGIVILAIGFLLFKFT